jgi:hypothetical protein
MVRFATSDRRSPHSHTRACGRQFRREEPVVGSLDRQLAHRRDSHVDRDRPAAPRHGLEHYCRDLNGWPRSWMGLEKDLPLSGS